MAPVPALNLTTSLRGDFGQVLTCVTCARVCLFFLFGPDQREVYPVHPMQLKTMSRNQVSELSDAAMIPQMTTIAAPAKANMPANSMQLRPGQTGICGPAEASGQNDPHQAHRHQQGAPLSQDLPPQGEGGGRVRRTHSPLPLPSPLLYPLPTATRTLATQCPPGEKEWRGQVSYNAKRCLTTIGRSNFDPGPCARHAL